MARSAESRVATWFASLIFGSVSSLKPTQGVVGEIPRGWYQFTEPCLITDGCNGGNF